MNKRNIIWIIITLFILTVIYSFYLRQKNTSPEEDSLPQSFTLNFYEDASSSGGNRNYEGTLIFMNGVLVDGRQAYDFSGNSTERHKKCITKGGAWVDIDTEGLCEISFFFEHVTAKGAASQFPLTKEGIQSLTTLGDIIRASKEQCIHFTLCYEIIKF